MSRLVSKLPDAQYEQYEQELRDRIGAALDAAVAVLADGTRPGVDERLVMEKALEASLAGLSFVIEELHEDARADAPRSGFCGRCGREVPDLSKHDHVDAQGRVERETPLEASRDPGFYGAPITPATVSPEPSHPAVEQTIAQHEQDAVREAAARERPPNQPADVIIRNVGPIPMLRQKGFTYDAQAKVHRGRLTPAAAQLLETELRKSFKHATVEVP